MNNISWINTKGPENEIILSSRVRLARNLTDIPFPNMQDEAQSKKVTDKIKSIINDLENKYEYYDIKELDSLKKQVLLESHLISPDLIKKTLSSGLLINDDNSTSIMINEEDHIRIQAILPGFQIKNAWEIASNVDNDIEKKVSYAFDENWGYLTSCPTNVGTGMRASVMIHLPALNLIGNVNKILQAVMQLGLTIRGLYGEGTEIIGNIFQISNQITLGRSEEEIVENLIAVTRQIVDKEREARNMLLSNSKVEIEDKVWRSWGIIKNARIMKSQECLKLLSDIRLGIDLNILPQIPIEILNEIMIDTQPANIQIKYKDELTPHNRDIVRAEIIRDMLK